MFMSPIKRTQEAVQRLELGAAQRKLWKTNSQRPSVEERMFLFERLQIILNNEARNRAHEAKQEFYWQDYMASLQELIMEEEDEDDPDDRFGDGLSEAGTISTMRHSRSSISGRSSTWVAGSDQDLKLIQLVKIGIDPSLRNRVWYEMLVAEDTEREAEEPVKRYLK